MSAPDPTLTDEDLEAPSEETAEEEPKVLTRAKLKPNKHLIKFSKLDQKREIYRMRLMGHTQDEIATKLSISRRAVVHALSEIKAANQKMVDEFDQAQFVGETMAVLAEVEHRAWQEYAKYEYGEGRFEDKHRLEALNIVRNARKDMLEAMLEVGHVARPTQEVQHTHVVQQLPWSDDLKEAVIKQMLESTLTPQLALPTPDPDPMSGKNLELNVNDGIIVKPRDEAGPLPGTGPDHAAGLSDARSDDIPIGPTAAEGPVTDPNGKTPTQ